MTPRLRTEQHLEFLSLKGGCTGSFESTRVKMPHCWKSHATAQSIYGSAHEIFEHVLSLSSNEGSCEFLFLMCLPLLVN